MKIFTDNIVIAVPRMFRIGENLTGEFAILVSIVASLQLELMLQGLLLRGGIAFGRHYMDDDVAMGDALLVAVDQDKSGMPPRIAVTKSCSSLLHFGHRDIEHAPYYYDLLVDDTGAIIVDYLASQFEEISGLTGSTLAGHRSAIIEGRQAAKTPEAAAKWTWLESYHNFVCTEERRYSASTQEDAAAIAFQLRSHRDLTLPEHGEHRFRRLTANDLGVT